MKGEQDHDVGSGDDLAAQPEAAGAGGRKLDVPTSEEFTRTLGQVAWLMTLSRPHLERPVASIRDMVLAPLMLKQVRVFLKGKQPVAAVTWAYASVEVKAKVATPPFVMALGDWRSGPELVVVECISPLLDPQVFVKQFLAQVDDALARGSVRPS